MAVWQTNLKGTFPPPIGRECGHTSINYLIKNITRDKGNRQNKNNIGENL